LAQLEQTLPADKNMMDDAIRKEIVKIEVILRKLEPEYAEVMRLSMKTFKDHVARAHHSVIEDFVLPISIPGLSD